MNENNNIDVTAPALDLRKKTYFDQNIQHQFKKKMVWHLQSCVMILQIYLTEQ